LHEDDGDGRGLLLESDHPGRRVYENDIGRASHNLSSVSVSCDEPNLVSGAGLLPAAVLAQKIGLAGLIEQRVRLAEHGANGGTKALTVIGSMLLGGDSVADTALLQAGATNQLFDQHRAPSTIGTWLRSFKWSNVRECDAVTRELLTRLWAAGAGPVDPAGPLTFDLDSTICPVYGRGKQGAGFGYTKVRGYHPQFATLAETGQVLFSRLRGGPAGAARGAKSFLTETISRLRHAGATGQLTVRADSAFYSRAVLNTARKFGVRFSVTVRQDKKVRAAIASIPESAWAPIPYWAVHPRGVRRGRRRDQLHLLRPHPRRQHRAPARASGAPDPGLTAGVVHRLRLPRHRHRSRW
jgi:hypothetical protein